MTRGCRRVGDCPRRAWLARDAVPVRPPTKGDGTAVFATNLSVGPDEAETFCRRESRHSIRLRRGNVQEPHPTARRAGYSAR